MASRCMRMRTPMPTTARGFYEAGSSGHPPHRARRLLPASHPTPQMSHSVAGDGLSGPALRDDAADRPVSPPIATSSSSSC